MIKEKISSQEIIDLVASKASVSKRAAEEFLKVMISTVEDALLAGDIVKIKNFGTFKLQWNESRKSVNIKTGDEIKLSGYYKVSFTPDSVLRVQVNEPFAHFETVELDGKSIKNDYIDENEEVALDPLRIFTEQASEIKSLISEIQALSINSKASLSKKKSPENLVEVKGENQPNEQNLEFQSRDDESGLTEDVGYENLLNNSPKESNITGNGEQISNEKLDSHPESDMPAASLNDLVFRHKKGVWVWLVIILFFITGISAGVYFTYPPATEYAKMTIANCSGSINKISDKFHDSGIYYYVSNWFSPAVKKGVTNETVVIPKDTNDFDSINQNQPIDTLQVLFDSPRVYKSFIATEQIKSGSRLTIMSKRYYGSKEYWVYIYEANKEQVSNPDNIAEGTIIKIPKLDSRLIDSSNPRCLKKALELHDIYIK